MNCGDFERAWNDRLDAGATAAAGADPVMEAHAAACPACRSLGARYQAISTLALAPTTEVPTGFADRVLAASAAEVSRPLRAWLVPLSAAAAVIAAVAVGVHTGTVGRWGSKPPRGPVARVRPIDTEGLSEALAVATSATWDFAREASAPAARVGRQVIGSAGLPGAPRSIGLPGRSARPSADVWRSVGDRVNAEVRPFEGTARHAFGFLLGPTAAAPPTSPREGS